MADLSLDNLELKATDGGTVISVKVVPGASRDRVAGLLGHRLKVTVRCPPEKGAANKAVARLLARLLDLKARDVEVASGQTRPEKTFLIRTLSPEEVRRRLAKR